MADQIVKEVSQFDCFQWPIGNIYSHFKLYISRNLIHLPLKSEVFLVTPIFFKEMK